MKTNSLENCVPFVVAILKRSVSLSPFLDYPLPNIPYRLKSLQKVNTEGMRVPIAFMSQRLNIRIIMQKLHVCGVTLLIVVKVKITPFD